MAVPLLPAPAMPIAKPLYSFGNQPAPSESATPKLAPAMPSSTPMANTLLKLCTYRKPYISATMMQLISTSAAFLRPMYCESTPSGKRINAPASVGSEIMSAACCAVR